MYDLALFLHILGVVMLVTSLAFSLGGFFTAQRARDVGSLRGALTFVPLAERLIPPAMLLILAAGLYLVGDGNWGWGTGWVDVALAIFALMMVLGPAVEGKRIGALHEKAAETPDGPIPPELDALRSDPVLTHTAAFGAMQVIGFLFLMTNKPSLGGALLTASVAAAVSVVLGRFALRLPAPVEPIELGGPARAAGSGGGQVAALEHQRGG